MSEGGILNMYKISEMIRKTLILLICINIIPMVSSQTFENHSANNNKIFKINNENSIMYNNNTEYWALLIGTGIFAGYPEEIVPSDLSAESMYESLLCSEHWQKENIKIITREEATKRNIKNGFHWLDENEDEDDIVVIYFASHGGQYKFLNIPIDFPPFDETDNCDEYLATYNSYISPIRSNLRDDELKSLINRLDSSGICVIIDCCFAGGFDDISQKSYLRGILPLLGFNTKKHTSTSFIQDFGEELSNNERVIILSSQVS